MPKRVVCVCVGGIKASFSVAQGGPDDGEVADYGWVMQRHERVRSRCSKRTFPVGFCGADWWNLTVFISETGPRLTVASFECFRDFDSS